MFIVAFYHLGDQKPQIHSIIIHVREKEKISRENIYKSTMEKDEFKRMEKLSIKR